MEKRKRAYFRLNIMTLFLIAVSFVSVTLAWFAYSGIVNVSTDVDVKAWNIELEKDGEKVSNDIVITLDEIYPGMQSITEQLKIRNLGDSAATAKYSIVSARILGDGADNYVINETTDSLVVEDKLSHDYPFNVNINLSKNYIKEKDGEIIFEVSVSWPLDSGNDEQDSLWGTKAYDFQKNEENKLKQDTSYQIQPSIQIVISVIAEQYLKIDTSTDPKYTLGSEILFDVINNKTCKTLSDTCIKTYVLDVNNTLNDTTVTLMPNPLSDHQTSTYGDYLDTIANITSTWNTITRPLNIMDILNIISTDINDSVVVRENLSDVVIGNLRYQDRMTYEINQTRTDNGYYKFQNNKFGFLVSSECYWTESNYNDTFAFAIQKMTESESKAFNKLKLDTCKAFPVINAKKDTLN